PAERHRRSPGAGQPLGGQRHPDRGGVQLHRPDGAAADADLGRHDPRRVRADLPGALAVDLARPLHPADRVLAEPLGRRHTRCGRPQAAGAMTVTDDASPALELDGLTTSFRVGGDWHPAIRDISLTLGRNETLALVGESGCGKSITAL